MERYETEEQQVEAIKAFWQRYGMMIVVSFVLLLAAILGWQWNENRIKEEREAISEQYQVVLGKLLDSGLKSNKAAEDFMHKYPQSEYAAFTALQLAKLHVEADDLNAALTQLQWAKQNSQDVALNALTTYRIARVMIELKHYDDALGQLEGLTVEGWQARAADLQGDILSYQGKLAEARAQYIQAQQATQGAASAGLQMKIDDLAQ